MPIVTVQYENEETPIEVEEGTRLVLAIENTRTHIGHRCGGFARCTTCRVEFLEGEPDRMTEAENLKLDERQLGGYRLSCQIAVDRDMVVRPAMTVESEGWSDPGPEPEASITPEPVWIEKPEHETPTI
jgi:ferredoxin